MGHQDAFLDKRLIPEFNLLKPLKQIRILQFVVIANNEALLPLQPNHDLAKRTVITKRHVAKMIKIITILNDRVMILNHPFVHFKNRRKISNWLPFVISKLKDI